MNIWKTFSIIGGAIITICGLVWAIIAITAHHELIT